MSVSSHLHPRGYVCSVDGADGSVGDGVNCAPAESLKKNGLFRDEGVVRLYASGQSTATSHLLLGV